MPRFLITIPSRLLYHIPKWHVQYSQKAFSALSNVPFRIMKQHVPCIGKGIYCGLLCKKLVFNALHLHSIIRVYGHSLLFYSSHAILSDFTRYKHSFSHDNIAWICICSSGYDGWITSSFFCSSSAILFPHGVTLLTVKTRRLRSSASP